MQQIPFSTTKSKILAQQQPPQQPRPQPQLQIQPQPEAQTQQPQLQPQDQPNPLPFYYPYRINWWNRFHPLYITPQRFLPFTWNRIGTTESIRDFGKLHPIGRGTFGSVFSAYDQRTRSFVALKTIKIDEKNPKMLSMIRKEVEIMQSFDHKNLVKFHRAFFELMSTFDEKSCQFKNNYHLVAVMELVVGKDLKAFLEANAMSPAKPLEEGVVWHFFSRICVGVQYMHRMRIMHRDLKPENVLLSHDLKTVKLGDFGLSRVAEWYEVVKTYTGTRYYMAPERAAAKRYSFESDVWSLGCILYEMAALKSTFGGERSNIESLSRKIYNVDYPPLPEDIYSPILENVVERCLTRTDFLRPKIRDVCDAAQYMDNHHRWITTEAAWRYAKKGGWI